MEKKCETIVGAIWDKLTHDGLVLLRHRTLLLGHGMIRSVRYLFLVHYLVLIFCFLTAFSLFALIYLVSIQISEAGMIRLTLPVGISGSLFLLCAGLFIFAIRENTWLQAAHLEELVDSVLGLSRPTVQVEPKIDSAEITRIVEEVIERRVHEIRKNPARNRKKTQPA